MMKKIYFIFCIFLMVIKHVNSQQISQWRGNNREGIYNESGLLKSWPEKGPDLVWSYEKLGPGYGSPVIANGKLFVNGSEDSTCFLFAFDLKGNIIWKTAYDKEYFGVKYGTNFPGARSTPTVYDNLVYVCSSFGKIACIETESGKIKWTLDIVKEFNGIPTEFGFSESLILDKDKIYCYTGSLVANVIALDRFTGNKIWQSKATGDSVSFCSPTIINLTSRNMLVTFSIDKIFALDTKTGELLWSHKQDTIKYGNQCNTPIYSDGYLYYVTEDGNGAVKLKLTEDGSSIQEVWRNRKSGNSKGGFVKIGNYIYTTSKDKKLLALNCSTGIIDNSLRIGGGVTIYADNMLYCYLENGDVNLVKVQESQIEVVSKFKVTLGTKEHFAHPVINDGILYIRHGNALLAYKIK